MSTLWLRLQGVLLTAAAVLLILVGAYGLGHRQAAKGATRRREAEQAARLTKTHQYRREVAEARVEAAQTATEVRNETDRLPTGSADARLRERWMRTEADDRHDGPTDPRP